MRREKKELEGKNVMIMRNRRGRTVENIGS